MAKNIYAYENTKIKINTSMHLQWYCY